MRVRAVNNQKRAAIADAWIGNEVVRYLGPVRLRHGGYKTCVDQVVHARRAESDALRHTRGFAAAERGQSRGIGGGANRRLNNRDVLLPGQAAIAITAGWGSRIT